MNLINVYYGNLIMCITVLINISSCHYFYLPIINTTHTIITPLEYSIVLYMLLPNGLCERNHAVIDMMLLVAAGSVAGCRQTIGFSCMLPCMSRCMSVCLYVTLLSGAVSHNWLDGFLCHLIPALPMGCS